MCERELGGDLLSCASMEGELLPAVSRDLGDFGLEDWVVLEVMYCYILNITGVFHDLVSG